MKQSRPARWAAAVLMLLAVALLVFDLDHVPVWALLTSLAAFALAAWLLSRPT